MAYRSLKYSWIVFYIHRAKIYLMSELELIDCLKYIRAADVICYECKLLNYSFIHSFVEIFEYKGLITFFCSY